MVTRVAGTKKPRKPSPRPSAQASAAALSNSSRAGAPDLDRLGERHKRTTHPPSGSHGLQPSRSAANLLRREHTYSGDSSPHNTTTPLRHALGEAVEAAGHAVGGSGAGSSTPPCGRRKRHCGACRLRKRLRKRSGRPHTRGRAASAPTLRHAQPFAPSAPSACAPAAGGAHATSPASDTPHSHVPPLPLRARARTAQHPTSPTRTAAAGR